MQNPTLPCHPDHCSPLYRAKSYQHFAGQAETPDLADTLAERGLSSLPKECTCERAQRLRATLCRTLRVDLEMQDEPALWPPVMHVIAARARYKQAQRALDTAPGIWGRVWARWRLGQMSERLRAAEEELRGARRCIAGVARQAALFRL